jgi:hypothetical protein
MPQASPDYNLYALRPDLIKEWHPTKNAGIKPQELTPGSGKKIWWICREGHEWEAVVYSRSRGSGCPCCNNSRSADESGVSVSNSEFKMEWHPTANGNLNPAYWTAGDSDKVWWICSAGHEWKTTFKARIKGKGCPVCDRIQGKPIQTQSKTDAGNGSVAEWADSMLEIEPSESIFGADFRKIKRFKTKSIVTVEVPATRHLFYAQMKNFSHEGMCLETQTALTPGTKVNIKLDRPLSATLPESYASVIKWCNGLTDDEGVVYNFGLGVKFI